MSYQDFQVVIEIVAVMQYQSADHTLAGFEQEIDGLIMFFQLVTRMLFDKYFLEDVNYTYAINLIAL
jgi:hypothetical protein